jgi:hypothetical protein
MAALDFPVTPLPGELYPLNPGTSGVTQYRWNNTKGVWDAVLSTVSLGSPNQGVYNDYQWPATDGAVGNQLTTDGTGNLTWDVAAAPSISVLSILPSELPFDGTRTAYTLVDSTLTPYAPNPSGNIVVFLGGVPQLPGAAYSVTASTINFLEAPLAGTTFYAITNVVV